MPNFLQHGSQKSYVHNYCPKMDSLTMLLVKMQNPRIFWYVMIVYKIAITNYCKTLFIFRGINFFAFFAAQKHIRGLLNSR